MTGHDSDREHSSWKLEARSKTTAVASSLLLTGALTSCGIGQGNGQVRADIDSSRGSVAALLPPTKDHDVLSVELTNGTSVVLECLTGEEGKQYQSDILNGTYKGIDKALLLTTQGLGLHIKSGDLKSLKECRYS